VYDLLVFIHVFSAVLWIGGVIGLLVMVQYTRKHEGAVAADPVVARVERLLLFYVAGPVLVLASGITMVAVSDAWSFSEPWVYLAIALFVVGTVVAGTAGGAERETRAARESGEVDGAALERLQGRYLRSVWASIVILASIEVLMVFKPGS
jgi:uncharacterized membrane protein